MTGDTLFGVPLVIDPLQCSRWIGALERAWRDFAGRPPERLEEDLRQLSTVFAQGVSAKTVRQRVTALPATPLDTADLPAGSVLWVNGCALITPEGRLLLEVLNGLQAEGGRRISPQMQAWALQTALEARAGWYATWIAKQFDGQLSAPALAAALFLLVNGSVGEQNALMMPRDPDRDLRLGSIVLPLLGDFGAALNGRDDLDRETGLRQHWAFTQISRYLARDIGRESAADQSGTRTYVRAGRQDALLEAVATRLMRQASPERREMAVVGFLDGYRAARPSLAAAGLVHEDPTATLRIRRRLLTDEAEA